MSSDMKLTTQIKMATTPVQALLILAEAIDELREAADPWRQPLEWADARVSIATQPRIVITTPSPDPEEIVALKAQLHGETDPDEARVLQARIALLENPGKIPPEALKEGERAAVQGDDIVAPPPSEERMADRHAFARRLGLHEFLDGGWTVDLAADTYAKGGGRWLYYDGGRDAIMAMPHWARQQICADIAVDSPQEAAEVARDILKAQQGVDMEAAVEAHQRAVGNG